MACQLLLVRHASIGEQYADKYVGSADLPLSPQGRRRVEPLADWLAARLCSPKSGRKIGRAWCSPKLRARQTADLIAARCPSLTFAINDDLREVDFGQWELTTFPQIAAAHPDQVAQWAEAGDDFTFPGGERRGDFRTRVAAAAARLAADPADIVLAVTHGGVVRQMICQLLNLDPRQDLMFKVRNATCAVIDLIDGKGVLTGLNLPNGGEAN